jgi:hypothetical protein
MWNEKMSSAKTFEMAEQGSKEREKAEVLCTSEHLVHKITKKERGTHSPTPKDWLVPSMTPAMISV